MKRSFAYIIAVFVLFMAVEAYGADEYAVIVNKQGPFANGISAETLRLVYQGDKSFESGVPLVPVNSGEGAVKDLFLKRVLKMTSKEYKLYWVKKVFQDGVAVPPTIVSPYEAVEYVKREKGAIAYIPVSSGVMLDGVIIIKQ